MKDLIKDILETSRDRIKTPITGSFALAFILWNWRPILILLFSGKSIEKKIDLIDKHHCDVWVLLAPLLIAIGYIVLIPYIMAELEKATKKAIERRKKHKAELIESDLDNDIIIAKKQFELEQARSGQRDIGELNDRIEELNIQIETQNAQHKKQVEELNNQIGTQNAQHKTQVENYKKLIESYEESQKRNMSLIDEYSTKALSSEQWNLISQYIDRKTTAELARKTLRNNEIEDFFDFCSLYIYKNNREGRLITSLSSIEKFKENLLITEDNNKYSITPIGEALYNSFA